MSKQAPKVPGENSAPEQVETPSLAEMQAQIARLTAQVERQNAPKVNKRDDRSALPNAGDIDVESLKYPVLTKDGWICPLKQSNPNTLR